ncbi:hypothetical protein PQX77_015592 [Marasmius sp. AFHP31]|nr:hypothetical protein PQX77_015592 [Marasmius sp. AFHP31]
MIFPVQSVSHSEKQTKRRTISTNLTEQYQEDWGDREGIRELIQNWYDGIIRQHRLRSSQDVEIIKTTPKNGKSFRFDAYRKSLGSIQASSSKSNGKPERVALGYIGFKISRGEKASDATAYNSDSESNQDGSSFRSELVLYNHRVQLTSNVLGMGVTDKRGDVLNLIGGHGEGMKVGILALVRNGHEVNYYTSGEKWKFGISSRRKQSPPELRAVIAPNAAYKNHEGLRVTVKGLKMEQLNDYFDGILFLHPPPPDTIL